jgi:DNA-binding CsgD family transcriptional regulator
MGRLIVGIELVVLVIALAILSLGGKIDLFLSFMPLVFTFIIPVISSLMIWKPGEVFRAFSSAFSMERLSGNYRKSLQIWEFLEKVAFTGGIIGILLFFVLLLTRFKNFFPIMQNGIWTAVVLFGLYTIFFGILFKIFRNTVFYLSQKPIRELNLEISNEFCKKYNITMREKEVIQLILRGRLYHEIADELFISIKTVKAHVSHVYEKTNSNGRVDLIRLLQFQ